MKGDPKAFALRNWFRLFLLWGGGVVCAGWLEIPALAQVTITGFKTTPYMQGLKEPWGASVHPVSGELYVAEKGANRIVAWRGGRATPVIESGWTITNYVANWAISKFKTREDWMKPALQQPGAICFHSNGVLYVCEYVPRGRILQFIPDASGNYTTASAIPVPWLDKPFLWYDVRLSDDGRLFVCGSDAETSSSLKFGTVLVLELNGDWWVVDYGPFVDFSAMCMSRDNNVLLVGERPKGALTWWDSGSHIPMGGLEETVAKAELVAVGILPDGSFLIGEKPAAAGAKCRLQRVDPMIGQLTTMAEGLASIGAIARDHKRDCYYVTDPQAGTVLECVLKEKVTYTETLLKQYVQGYEMAQGFTPKEAPGFLKSFFSKLDVGAAGGGKEQKGRADGTSEVAVQFSLRDFAGKIPIIAGRIRTQQLIEGDDKDPVQQMDFILMFPGKAIVEGEFATPSMSFFSAKRKSGKVEQTRPIFQGLSINRRLDTVDWTGPTNTPAALYAPLVSCGMEKLEGGIAVNLMFLGLGFFDDYYISLFSGATEKKARVMVENDRGEQATYSAAFTEAMSSGEVVQNLVVAGFDPKSKGSVGWLKIGKWAVGQGLEFGDTEQVQQFSSMDEDVKGFIDKKRTELRVESGRELEVKDEPIVPSVVKSFSGGAVTNDLSAMATNAPNPAPASETNAAAPQ